MSDAAVLSDIEALLGTSGAGRRLGVSAERVRQLISEGKLPATKTALGNLVRADDVDALARDRERRRRGGGDAAG